MYLPRCQSQSIAALLVVGLLYGCSEMPTAGGEPPVAVEASPVVEPPPPPYRVRSGDSLSTIAEALGIDYLALAELNALSPPYTIFEGQVLSTDVGQLNEAQRVRIARARRELIRAIREGEGAPEEVGGVSEASSQGETAEAEATAAGEPIKNTVVDTRDAGAAVADTALSANVSVEPPPAVRIEGEWVWPATGEVLAEFSLTDNKGLDIAVPPGEPVRAVAGGIVQQVYTDAPRYGGLIVVKHDEQHLGFYGYVSRVLVARGERVEIGQPIAEASTDGAPGKVHFELRRDAQPVNPRDVFPAR